MPRLVGTRPAKMTAGSARKPPECSRITFEARGHSRVWRIRSRDADHAGEKRGLALRTVHGSRRASEARSKSNPVLIGSARTQAATGSAHIRLHASFAARLTAGLPAFLLKRASDAAKACGGLAGRLIGTTRTPFAPGRHGRPRVGPRFAGDAFRGPFFFLGVPRHAVTARSGPLRGLCSPSMAVYALTRARRVLEGACRTGDARTHPALVCERPDLASIATVLISCSRLVGSTHTTEACPTSGRRVLARATRRAYRHNPAVQKNVEPHAVIHAPFPERKRYCFIHGENRANVF